MEMKNDAGNEMESRLGDEGCCSGLRMRENYSRVFCLMMTK